MIAYDFQMSSIFERAAKLVFERLVKKSLDRFFSHKSKIRRPKKRLPAKSGELTNALDKSHPWRLCPPGQHWVRAHPLTIPASSKSPERDTIRNGHCRTNPSKADFYDAAEFKEIAKQYFGELEKDSEIMPVPDSLGFPNGNKYDNLIAGWTKFWNEILRPRDPLTPDFVKALIATESSFNLLEDVQSKAGPARGLIQVTESTRKILQNPKGELRNHLIKMTQEESREPEVNIAAGVRWLHHKKELAEKRLKQEITWEEAGAEYKGILPHLGKHEKVDRIMQSLRDYHKQLKNQRK